LEFGACLRFGAWNLRFNEIPNHKFQITNKFKIPNSKFKTGSGGTFFVWNLEFGACLEFGIWCLVLV
jgi:hypothetical protein